MPNTALLPRPVVESWEWQFQGACRTADPDQFFHPADERGESRWARTQEAKKVCVRCPVILQCRAYALTANEEYGIWGGLDERERRDLKHRGISSTSEAH